MKSKEKEFEKYKRDVLSNLPGFINQLLLLLKSGTNLEDSMRKICESYSGSKSNFKLSLYSIYVESSKTGESIIVLFNSYSKKMNIKELSRVSNIMLENRLKGVELWDKLNEEGTNLWLERKTYFLEQVKVLDSKLTLPLALMLISLILISICPALLEIS